MSHRQPATSSTAPTRVPAVSVLVRDVTAEYFPDQPILRRLTLRAPAARLSLIIGPNGSGKSTALRALAGLLRTKSGSVVLEQDGVERDITAIPAHLRTSVGIGFLPQGHTVFPAMSVFDNLILGGWAIRRDRARLHSAVEDVFERYPILKAKRAAAAGSLSGGQQRILELARMLVPDPPVLLIDEPAAGVAPALAAEMYAELGHLRSEGRTIVLVDQDVRPALAIADEVHVLQSGRVSRSGPAAEIGTELTALVRGWLSIEPDRESS